MSRRPVEVLLQHILDAANEACSFATGRSREELDTDRQLQHSLVRCIEIIGEAASRVDVSFQRKHPEIPWAEMTAMRNRLIHAYFDIDLNVVWTTVQSELPKLITQIEKMTSE